MQIALECILLFPTFLFTFPSYSFQGKKPVSYYYDYFYLQCLALRQTNSGYSMNVCGIKKEKKLEG